MGEAAVVTTIGKALRHIVLGFLPRVAVDYPLLLRFEHGNVSAGFDFGGHREVWDPLARFESLDGVTVLLEAVKFGRGLCYRGLASITDDCIKLGGKDTTVVQMIAFGLAKLVDEVNH